METALSGIHASVEYTFFTGDNEFNHAYDNWHEIDPNSGNCVSEDVINFFEDHP
jgi:hypothetical protein